MINLPRSKRVGFVILIACFIFLGFRAGNYLSRFLPVQAADLSTVKVQLENTPVSVTISSPVRDIVLLMLRSGEKWHRINFEGNVQVFQYPYDLIQKSWTTGMIEQDSKTGPFRFYITTSREDGGEPAFLSISDGKTLWNAQGELQVYESEPLGLGLLPPDELPSTNDANHPFIPHPMAGKIGTPFANMVFPQGFAQQLAVDLSADKIKILEQEKIAGREALVIQYDMDPNTRFELWVDEITGIILKARFYDIRGIKDHQWYQQVEVTQLQMDVANEQANYVFDPADYTEVNFREYDQVVNQELDQKGIQK